MLSLWTKGADVAWRFVHQSVSNHFVLPFEAFAPFPPIAASHRTVVRPFLRVHICMRTGVLISIHDVRWERRCTDRRQTYFNRYCV